MDIGICTTDFTAMPPDILFQKIQDYGFSQVQFNFAAVGEEDMPENISAVLIRKIRNATQARQLKIVAINGTFNVIDPDPDKRKQGTARFEPLADACRQLDCRILTLCTGTMNPDSMWSWHPDNESEQAWAEMLETLRILVGIAEKYQICLGVETEASNVVSSPERARRLLDEIDSPCLKIIMDCANLFPPHTASLENVRPVMKNAFSFLGKDIILAHGKDILAAPEIRFASPGKGIIDYDYFLELLGQYGYRGGMILHGIRQPADIRFCVNFMREKIARHENH
ncbi:MAG TPA: hypothetical protein DD640_02695 [Clostridiales bacterium]|nr:hypothetical protein [Clostridiales bacterium]